MTTDKMSPVYEVRYGWDGKTLGVVAVSAVFTVILLVADASPVLRGLGLALFGGGGLFMAFTAMSRKPAFRVDETGVLLGGSPARYRATTAHVPWQDITAIVLWRQQSAANIPWVGVARRPGAAPLPGPGQGRFAQATAQAFVPGVPADVVLASRTVAGWRLDRTRLAAAVDRFAPGVPVVDAG
ncbi:hypothetical protein ACFWOJ_10520 [Streptomyces sp. NPDC058439]|uniref:hypothetical protein n=1 Tax=Streptomyces sp. NPDC058439 TaxID=3346500 RepID=UPI003667F937